MPNSLRLRYLLQGCLLWMLVLMLFSQHEAQATHIRAGDITAKRDTTPNPNPRRFFFTMIIYRDQGSNVQDFEANMIMGDGNTVTVPRLAVVPIGNLTEKQVFKWEYTYSADGNYTIAWNGINRNGGIANISPPSDQVSFFISTTINISAFRFNSTPVLTVAPIDLAAVGRRFVHNPGAFDADGDSLAFKLRVPQRLDGTGNVVTVPGYTLPDRTYAGCRTSDDSGPSFLTLDLRDGQLVWDSPCRQGEYNVAFVVEEWRISPNGGAIKLGEVVRDMQILVRETPNRPPVLEPKDTCVVAGTSFTSTVRATDPDGDLITLTANGGILPPATFGQVTNAPGVATGRFSWSTQCTDVRAQPYQVIFRAEDVRPPVDTRLTDLVPWNIRVVGPAPQNLVATAQDRSVRLDWDLYTCQNASRIRVYRREGPSGFEPGVCETGIPASAGYTYIGDVGRELTTFVDDNGGQGLREGVEYCYRIYAVFPLPGGGESIASNEACAGLARDIPYLTNVTVDVTDGAQGQITVRWTQPGEGSERLVPPLSYRLSRRAEGGAYQEVKATSDLSDTVFVDTGLNTAGQGYRYRLEFFQAGGTVLRDSASASSVRLTAQATAAGPAQVSLVWGYRVPWSNAQAGQRVFRRQGTGAFAEVGQATGTAESGSFTDTQVERGQAYCYYVETRGSYGIPGLPEPLLNLSQQVCVQVPRLVCPPQLSIDALDCEQFLRDPQPAPYRNVLTWVPAAAGECTDRIAYYTVFFRAGPVGEYAEVGRTEQTRFEHQGLASFAGCYVVTATTEGGEESAYSNEVCKDNCLFFSLPNIITPNGDGRNDVFRPDRRSVFVRATTFRVFNRWGGLLFEGSDDAYINWPGVDSKGNRLPDGVYYYEAEVSFLTLDPERERQTYKGWVEIVR